MSRLLRIFCAHANNLQLNSNRHALLNCTQYGGQAQQRSSLLERNFSNNYVLCNKTELTEARTDKGNKKPSAQGNKITLLAQNQAVTITTLEEAVKLAKRRDLHLVQVQEMDNKTQRPVYKLVKAAELLESELEDSKDTASAAKDKSAHKKSEKSLTMGSRIAEHDLQSRIKNISKWLSKQHEVRVLLQANNAEDMSNCERIAKTIEQSIKEPTLIGKIVQKRSKGTNMKFTIVPLQGVDNKIQTKPS